jgi:hypothetical protein
MSFISFSQGFLRARFGYNDGQANLITGNGETMQKMQRRPSNLLLWGIFCIVIPLEKWIKMRE